MRDSQIAAATMGARRLTPNSVVDVLASRGLHAEGANALQAGVVDLSIAHQASEATQSSCTRTVS